MGPSRYKKSFCVHHIMFLGKSFGLHNSSWVLKGRFKQLLVRRERECRNNRGGVKKQKCKWSRVLALPQRIYIYITIHLWVLSESSSLPTPLPQVEDGNFSLSTRFLEHCPINSIKGRSQILQPSLKISAIETLPWKTSEFRLLSSLSHPFSPLCLTFDKPSFCSKLWRSVCATV